ncbi:hypothetical protein B9Z55_006687 [Caenorhabditis nigoni]|uniref:Uncharacterized protein n=1 Tax=Caenorhabditis nigoni TaxID=1611254 RepID=A0A2G5V6C3_9PELO|nr:hypothetical protein B9Z55_006687 [Caenorhabditis nigoni]
MKGNTWTSGPISRASRTVRRDDIGTIQIRTTGAEEQKERGSLDFGTNFGDFEDGFQGRLQNWHGSNQDGRKGRVKWKARKWELVKFQNFQIVGDAWTLA